MNKRMKAMILMLVIALVAAAATGCGCQKQPSQPQQQTTSGTEAATQPSEDGQNATDPSQETAGGQNATDPTVRPIIGEGVEDWGEGSSDPVRPSDPTGSTEGNDPAVNTQPSASEESRPSTGESSDGALSYETYLKMTTSQQQAFFKSFDDPDQFYDWLEAAEAEYEAAHSGNVITGGGTVDVGELIDKITGR